MTALPETMRSVRLVSAAMALKENPVLLATELNDIPQSELRMQCASLAGWAAVLLDMVAEASGLPASIVHQEMALAVAAPDKEPLP